MADIWTFHSAGEVVFGCGAVDRLGHLAGQRGLRRIFVITDAALVQVGACQRVCDALGEAGLTAEVFDGGQPEPAIALAEGVVDRARTFQPDAVLGLGGGSNMDLAKVVACVLEHGGGLKDYVGDCRVPGPVRPIVCVPTTAGTGSEVTAAAVLTDTQQQLKVGILSNYLRPRLAVVDPEMTFSCPPKVTADSGIDALTHAIEAYTAVDNDRFPLPAGERSVYQGRNPLVGCLAEKAIELIGQHLPRAVHHSDDRAAREGMALAALLAGLAFSNSGVALVHAMEYPVGGAVHCSHGAGNGLLLPFVMRYNLPARRREFARVAQLLGEDVTGLNEQAAAERAIEAVERLRQEINIPARLRDLGVQAEQLPEFARKAFGIQRILRVNPRPVTRESIEEIYRWAL